MVDHLLEDDEEEEGECTSTTIDLIDLEELLEKLRKKWKFCYMQRSPNPRIMDK